MRYLSFIHTYPYLGWLTMFFTLCSCCVRDIPMDSSITETKGELSNTLYTTITVDLPQIVEMTRAKDAEDGAGQDDLSHSPSDASSHTYGGNDYERKITDALVLFVRNGVIVSTNQVTLNQTLNHETGRENSTVTITSKVKEGEYEVLVILNPAPEIENVATNGNSLSTLNEIWAKEGASITASQLAQTKGIMMTNAKGLISININDLYKSENEAKQHAKEITVERTVAKIYMHINSDISSARGYIPSPTEQNEYSWTTCVENKKMFFCRQFTTNYAGTMETASNLSDAWEQYAKDPNFTKVKGVEMSTEEYYPEEFDYNIPINQENTTNWGQTIYTTSFTEAVPTHPKTMSGKYVIENTIGKAELQYYNQSTMAILKTAYRPKDLRKNVQDATPYTFLPKDKSSRTWVRYNGQNITGDELSWGLTAIEKILNEKETTYKGWRINDAFLKILKEMRVEDQEEQHRLNYIFLHIPAFGAIYENTEQLYIDFYNRMLSGLKNSQTTLGGILGKPSSNIEVINSGMVYYTDYQSEPTIITMKELQEHKGAIPSAAGDKKMSDLLETAPFMEVYLEGISYYFIPIRHFNDNQQPQIMAYGRFGVVRNNIYRIDIAQLNSPGSSIPVVPPKTPDEKKHKKTDDKNIVVVNIDILKWLQRKHRYDL